MISTRHGIFTENATGHGTVSCSTVCQKITRHDMSKEITRRVAFSVKIRHGAL